MAQGRLLTVDAAAERLSTSPRFIRRLIAERRIEFVKVGRHVRISESALAEFIDAGRVEPLDCGRYPARHERSCVMANKDGHRRFGNVRMLPSGRYQIRYPGPDGRIRTGPETYERKGDADRALVLIESDMRTGQWTDPERGRVKLADYAATWIIERPGPTAPDGRQLSVAAQEAHRAAPGRRAGREAVNADDPRVARNPARQRRVGLDRGQGIPLLAGRAHDGGRGRQDSAS